MLKSFQLVFLWVQKVLSGTCAASVDISKDTDCILYSYEYCSILLFLNLSVTEELLLMKQLFSAFVALANLRYINALNNNNNNNNYYMAFIQVLC